MYEVARGWSPYQLAKAKGMRNDTTSIQHREVAAAGLVSEEVLREGRAAGYRDEAGGDRACWAGGNEELSTDSRQCRRNSREVVDYGQGFRHGFHDYNVCREIVEFGTPSVFVVGARDDVLEKFWNILLGDNSGCGTCRSREFD